MAIGLNVWNRTLIQGEFQHGDGIMQGSQRLVDAVVASQWRGFKSIARQLAELSEDSVPTLIASASHSDQNRRAVGDCPWLVVGCDPAAIMAGGQARTR